MHKRNIIINLDGLYFAIFTYTHGLKTFRNITFYTLCLAAALFISGQNVYAQKADSSKITIHILNNRVVTFTHTDSGDFFRFVGDVIMQQGTDTLYCDSLYQNKTTNVLQAFSNVRIAQEGGTQGTCDYLRYTAASKIAFMQGNVVITDGKNRLWTEDLTYNLGTKVGEYDNTGTLQADSTLVTSNRAIYNVKSKEAHFLGNVIVKDPQYHTKSQDMTYNTETKLTQFFAKSLVVGDSGRTILQTSNGYYDNANGVAGFNSPSSVWYDGQYIESDTLYYNKKRGLSYAYGHVIAVDTGHHSTLYCGRATYHIRKRVMWAVDKPVLQTVNGKDTLYMRADTFYSAPMLKPKTAVSKFADSVNAASKKQKIAEAAAPKEEKKGRKKKKEPTIAAIAEDTTAADSTAPLLFTGYHHVKIFSDSLQGVCDSIIFTQTDSCIRMISNPVAWSRNSQVTGDTIIMKLGDSNRIKSIYVPNNAFIVSLAGPADAELYDQVQGRTLRGAFKNNAITDLNVYPNAEVIYYSKDDHGAYIGVLQAKGDRMRVSFADQSINKIHFDKNVHQTLTPLEKADIPNTRFSRFKWLPERRPLVKEELFE